MTYHANQLAELDSPLWFCLRARPKREHIAAARLRQIDGVEVLSPQIRFRKSTRRGTVWFVEALFPGYLFAGFRYALLHRQICSVPGITGVLHFGDRIPVLDSATIAQLTASCGDRQVIVIDPQHAVGDTVQIVGGPFQGLAGMITKLASPGQRIKVLLEFLGRDLEVEIPATVVLPQSLPRTLIDATRKQ